VLTLSPIENSSEGIPACAFDLGAMLWCPESLFAEQLADRWVVFAPDRPGLPVVVDSRTMRLLKSFEDGAVVSDALAGDSDFGEALAIVAGLEERGFLREHRESLPYPVPPRSGKPQNFSIWLHITNWCNLGCEYCFVGEKTHEGMSEASMDVIAREIRTTALRNGTEQVDVKFAGGEATLVLPKMVSFRDLLLRVMADTNVRVNFGVLSNGTAVSDKLIAFLKGTGTGLSISVDGFAESHDIYRTFKSSKRGSWSVVSQNVQRLVANGIRPYIMGTISEESCATLPELVQWIYGHGLRCRLSVVRQPKGNWGMGQADEYVRLCTTLAEAFDRAFTALEDPSIAIDLRNGLDLCELHFDQPSHGAPCGIANNHVVIKPDATLVACPMTIQEPGVESHGDLLETCAHTFTPRPSERYVPPGKNDCRQCKWFPVCSGGCPITNLRIKGYAYTRSPLCAFYKNVIPRYLRFFGTKLVQAQQRSAAAVLQ
jgi:uncharacterized protein